MPRSATRHVTQNVLLDEATRELENMRVAEAVELFNQAELAAYDADDCAAGRWNCHMLAGNFELAWRESDSICARANPDPHRFWDGQPVDGRDVLIRCLHGLGDTIQFIRYAPLLRERCRSVTIEAQPSLRTILKASALADNVITWGDREPDWNQQVEIMELPRVFRTGIENVPSCVPYLKATSAIHLPEQQRSRLNVGLVWRSSSFNPLRSLSASQAASLFEVAGAKFYSLQAGPERLAMSRWAEHFTDLQLEENCIEATAGIIHNLDLLITVDTMVAHLAGALGRPVWTLLPFRCDWRWMLEREDSPWYPTMRLFRQSTQGSWDHVIDRIKLELSLLAESKINR